MQIQCKWNALPNMSCGIWMRRRGRIEESGPTSFFSVFSLPILLLLYTTIVIQCALTHPSGSMRHNLSPLTVAFIFVDYSFRVVRHLKYYTYICQASQLSSIILIVSKKCFTQESLFVWISCAKWSKSVLLSAAGFVFYQLKKTAMPSFFTSRPYSSSRQESLLSLEFPPPPIFHSELKTRHSRLPKPSFFSHHI